MPIAKPEKEGDEDKDHYRLVWSDVNIHSSAVANATASRKRIQFAVPRLPLDNYPLCPECGVQVKRERLDRHIERMHWRTISRHQQTNPQGDQPRILYVGKFKS
jgi:hypothetical protein